MNYKKIFFIFTNIIFLVSAVSCSFLQEKTKPLKERKITNKKKVEHNSFVHYLQKIENYKKLGQIPLIDVEISLSQWPKIQELINEMDKGGVALAGITSPKKNEIKKIINRFPERFFPMTGLFFETPLVDNQRNLYITPKISLIMLLHFIVCSFSTSSVIF